MNDVLVAIRQYNEELTEICQEFLVNVPYPIQLLRYVGVEFEQFLFAKVFDLDCRCVVLIDEDCFVFRPESIQELVDHVRGNGYAACGIPDGGVKGNPLRRSPLVPNVFFCIIDLERLRQYLGTAPSIESSDYEPDRVYELPSFLDGTRYNVSNVIEDYYRFFFWMLNHGERIKYLRSKRRSRATVVCDHLDRECAIHAWFARNYQKHGERDRVLNVRCYAVSQLRKSESECLIR